MSTQTILIFAETHQNKLADITFELLGGAREVAAATGGEVVALLLGHGVESLAGKLSAADRIILIDDSQLAAFSPRTYVSVIEAVVAAERPRMVWLGSTTIGLDIASLLAARLGSPCVNACQKAAVKGDIVEAVSRIFAGKMLAEVSVVQSPAILTILPGSYREKREGGKALVEPRPCPVALDPSPIEFEAMIQPESGDIDITQHEILVSIGRGIQQQENIEVAQELADAIGGALSASRPVIDQGWLPSTRQVGKSGMTVKPKCYMALGISGAPEHVEGMKDSELIVAINSDPHAPIFDIATYGVVADMMDIIPVLTNRLKQQARV